MIHIIQNDSKAPAGHFAKLLQGRRIEHEILLIHSGASWPNIADGDGLIVLGGYMGANDEEEYPFLRTAIENLKSLAERNVPLLTLCLGAQMLAKALGACVHNNFRSERGNCFVTLTTAGRTDPLLTGLASPLAALQWHQDSFDLPTGASLLAGSQVCPNQIFRYKRAYGVQFHPEVTIDTVANWVNYQNADTEILSQFVSAWPVYRETSERLLTNFISLCKVSV